MNTHSTESHDPTDEGAIDVGEILRRVGRGIGQSIGFALLGVAIAATAYFATKPWAISTVSTQVTFSFEGLSKGEYPDGSKFQADDLRAPDIIAEALTAQGLGASSTIQSDLRAALTIDGVIAPEVAKQREKMRSAGQVPPPYVPDEYIVSLVLPRNYPLSQVQRTALLRAIPNLFREKFVRTYAAVPIAFGSAFSTLHKADFFEYELVLNRELENISSYLNQQIETAKRFRSPTTNLSFSDLLTQADVFAQIRMNEVLGLINQYGLSRDRTTAMVKLDYYIRTLENQEFRSVQQEQVVKDLLTQTQNRASNYVLGVKTQAAQPKSDSPLVDQGLIDSLLANDSYSMLVRKALDAGLEVKRIQSEKTTALERKKLMEGFMQKQQGDQSAVLDRVQASLAELEDSYKALVENIRKTQADFARQKYADAIRLSDTISSDGWLRPVIRFAAVGGFIGLALGVGLSLLGIYAGGIKHAR